MLDGVATLAVAWTGMGGQRALRLLKGVAFVLAALLILAGHHHGNFILSMIFGTLFLLDGALQAASAWVVRYPRWRAALVGAGIEILLAIFFYQPYPTHYLGTVPYCLGLGLMFSGWSLLLLGYRVRRLPQRALLSTMLERPTALFWADQNTDLDANAPLVWDGPPAASERALTVHVWTPVAPPAARPCADR